MTTLKKFMFDTDFDLDDIDLPVAEPEEIVDETVEPALEPVEELPPTFTEAELAAARTESFSQGKQEGLSESLNSIEAKLSDCLTNLDAKIRDMATAQIQANEQLQNDAIALSLALVRKILPTYNDQNALDEVERMVVSVVSGLLQTPRIILKVNESLAEPITERIEKHLSLSGFAGEFSVVGDSDIAMGDCRVEWVSGYAERNLDNLMTEIDGIIARNLDEVPVVEETDPETKSEAYDQLPDEPVAAAESSIEAEEEPPADDAETIEPIPTPVADTLEEFDTGDDTVATESNEIGEDVTADEEAVTDAVENTDTVNTDEEDMNPLPSSDTTADDKPV